MRRALTEDEAELLGQLRVLDQTATEPQRDQPFRVALMSQAWILMHRGLPRRSREISRRALEGLVSAGALESVERTHSILSFYLAPEEKRPQHGAGSARTADATAPGGDPHRTVQAPAEPDSRRPDAARQRRRRALALADPRGTFERALLDVYDLEGRRLTKTAVAGRMGIDRTTLSDYVKQGYIPEPPWEDLARILDAARERGPTE